jgi:hypothetical protein
MQTLPQRSASPSAQPGADSPVVALALKALARLGIPPSSIPLHAAVPRGRPSTIKAGDRFGRLVVVERAGSRQGNALFACRCDCGNVKVVRGADLRYGATRSCGCLSRELSTKHGMWNSPAYKSWTSMLQRCEDPKHKSYQRYGGADVTVCERWHSFENFYADLGARPAGTTLGGDSDASDSGEDKRVRVRRQGCRRSSRPRGWVRSPARPRRDAKWRRLRWTRSRSCC